MVCMVGTCIKRYFGGGELRRGKFRERQMIWKSCVEFVIRFIISASSIPKLKYTQR